MDPVVLFRAWRATTDDHLASCYRRVRWPRGTFHAVCLPRNHSAVQVAATNPHAAPGRDCECGVWGCYSMDALGVRFIGPGWSYVYGAALGFGDVSYSVGGMRVERARPLALGDDSNDPARSLFDQAERYTLLVRLAKKYGIALRPIATLHNHAARFGDIVNPFDKPAPGEADGRPDLRR